MTDIEKKALALFNEVARERGATHDSVLLDRAFVENEALCRAIEQHEAFRQEVSDALLVYQKAASTQQRSLIWDALTRFIIAKPDPLVEAIREMALTDANQADADRLCEALAKRGGKIVWEND